MRTPFPARLGFWPALLLAVASMACDSGPTGTTNDEECGSPTALGSCPSWSSFSPAQADKEPTPTPEAPTITEQTAPLERFDEDTGDLVSLGNVTFVCTAKEYDFVNNPDRALSFNIDETVIWPGSLIQGQSHRDASAGGATGLLELPIRERSPVEVSLTFNNQNSSAVISDPTTGSVNAAVRGMIGDAEAQGLATANNITFSQETYTSEQQAAIAFGVSGRYLGFEASASGSFTRAVTTNVVAAQLMQQMYVVNVTQPATPAAFFGAGADQGFQDQVALGRVGAGNPPLYVSRIGYGRMMVFSMSAKAEATEIKGAIDAAYRGIGGGGAASLTAKDASILSTAEIRISQVGGDQSNALAAIQSGNLADYFTDVVPLTAAQPIWFELKSLTGQVALVSEPGTYTETSCEPKLPGTFDFSAVQNVTIPFTAGTERTVLQADVNGDGSMDLVFNERRTAPPLNRVHVALAQAGGTFALQSAWTHPENPGEGWENFDALLVADVDGDQRADLVWNALTASQNALYTAMSLGDGSYEARPRQERPAGGWNNYSVRAGDLNADGQDDLIWSNAGPTASSILRTYYALAQADSTFYLAAPPHDVAGNYSGYAPPRLAQFDGMNGLDFVVNALGDTYNNAYVGRFTPTSATLGTWSFPAPFGATQNGWSSYRLRVGNVDGQNGADLVWVHSTTGRTYRGINTGVGTWVTSTPPFHDNVLADNTPFLADFNNDGRSDLLLVSLGTDTNELKVGFGRADGTFTFPVGVQMHPAAPAAGWQTFDDIFVGDVNGDTKADIVWTNAAGSASIYVALSK
ncbi:MAG: FG-GAP-like repeat-containing protein [Gemmatimonadales bacterium]